MSPVVIHLHAFATLAMTGLIWFVQVVHYPMFADVGRDRFAAYEARHQRLTTWVVGPLMLVEAMTAMAIIVQIGGGLAVAGGVCVALLWLSTALVQVPLHRRLCDGFDADAHRQLIATNWVRTALWSARSVIALLLLDELRG